MIEKNKLKEVLIEQRNNILKKELGIRRTVLDEVKQKKKLPHIIVIAGLRRTGKSTLLRQIMSELYHDENFYYINFEDERLFNYPAEKFNELYEILVEIFGKNKTFFIDEIQNINNFEIFVRRFYDMGFKFYVTGSNAKLLSKDIGTRLTGRHVDIIVNPFSFREFLTAKGLIIPVQNIYETETRAQIKKYFSEYLTKGGMPEFVIYDDPDILLRIYDDIVMKDIFLRYNVENKTLVRELYKYLINTFSQKFSFNSLMKFMHFGSPNTVKKYIDYLEDTYLTTIIHKFDFSLKKQILNDKKVYLIDNAFINILTTKTTKDKGWLLENLVFNEIKKRRDVFYYSNCDFLILQNNDIKELIQVTWALTKENKEREINGLLEAMKKFKQKQGLILTYDQEDEISVGTKKIIVKPIWRWLLK